MKLKNLVRIGTNKRDDIISKGENAGYLGILQDPNLRRSLPDIASTGDFPRQFKVKSHKKMPKQTGSLMSRTKYQQTKFREEETDLAGLEAGKINDFQFRSKRPMVYNPFANAAGNISQTGGYNKGGDEEFRHKKDKDEIIKPRFKLGKRVGANNLPDGIKQPDPFPVQLQPDTKVKKPSGFIIKSTHISSKPCI